MKIFPCHFINLDQRSFIRLQKAGEDQKWRPSEELSHSYCPTAQFVHFPSFLPFSHSCCISCWPDWKKWRKVSNFADFDWKLVVNSIWQAHQEKQQVSMDIGQVSIWLHQFCKDLCLYSVTRAHLKTQWPDWERNFCSLIWKAFEIPMWTNVQDDH